MKAMWTAASGMKSLQLKIDTVSNNLANVNTNGYKKQRIEFKDMMYDKMTDANFLKGEGTPVGVEIGHGVLPAATTRSFSNGNYEQTDANTDLAVNGEGFFVIKDPNGNEYYTRDGNFKFSILEDGAFLTTSGGLEVQGEAGRIALGANVEDIKIDTDGNIMVKRTGAEESEKVDRILLKKFLNPEGLDAVGKNLFQKTIASGEPTDVNTGTEGEIWQGYLENSNVQVVEEMINLITAQRAYEVNSKTIQTVDRMMEVAVGLKR